MARRASTLDPQMRQALKEAQKMIEDVAKADGNEAETRRRVERFFETLMGYDVFKHVSREHAIGKAGQDTSEHCDFAIQIEDINKGNPIIIIELKKVNVDLAQKHINQASTYAIDKGCEWVVLTNGREWRLYHVSFTRPPQTKMLSSWDLLTDDLSVLASNFELIGYKNVRKGGLDDLWQKTNVLKANNLLNVILSPESIKIIRRELKKTTDVLVSPEDIVGGIRRMLNEAALGELSNMKISLPATKKRGRKKKADNVESEGSLLEGDEENIIPEDFDTPEKEIAPSHE
jgi:predicted type IV restriction endonuclease